MATLDGISQKQILVHATLVGLTPLIPFPFVDDMVKGQLQRRLVRTLADVHGLDLGMPDVKVLADDPPRSWVKGVAVSTALYPLRVVLRKTFIVLQGKRIVDLASDCYHRGYLTDHAFRERWCAPLGPRRAADVRAAVDAVCAEVPTRPVAHALRTGFNEARAATTDLAGTLLRALGRVPPDAPPEEVQRVVDDAALDSASGIAERLRRAVAEVPAEHFDDMRRRLDEKLGAS